MVAVITAWNTADLQEERAGCRVWHVHGVRIPGCATLLGPPQRLLANIKDKTASNAAVLLLLKSSVMAQQT